MKDGIYEAIAQIGKATSSPKRLELLDILCQGEKTVEELTAHSQMSMKLTSAHLRSLRTARLVETRRSGKNVFYRAANDQVASFWVAIRSLAEQRYAEIGRTLDDYFARPTRHEEMTALDRKTLLRRVRDAEVVVIDVRPESEYQKGHLPHALSIPLGELKRRLAQIPKSKEVIAYCRGPYCVLSHEAVQLLRKKGYRATRLSDGVAEWKTAGFPVQSAQSPQRRPHA
ncbi:MAG: metalloregulator ArsR/SmtB family transcription factor [Bdellovibrionales bacterium]|nr:metalloregulator ArsR/SmtB family transcription factor [Bdellovibrionales bacterium]